MRATEIIRGVLDIIDSLDAEPAQTVTTPEPQDDLSNIYDDDLNRIKMIAGVLPDAEACTTYANEPAEQIAPIEAVTTLAGGGPNKPKHPADIKSNSLSMFPAWLARE
jgi:hypothetical protein